MCVRACVRARASDLVVNMAKQEREKRIMLQIAMHVLLDSTSAQKTYMGPYELNDYFHCV